jgi:hypothetical protein
LQLQIYNRNLEKQPPLPMSFVSTSLERANKWDEICFSVKAVPLNELLPAGYRLLATDRQTAVVGEEGPGSFQIFALQGKQYSLIPNLLLRQIIDECIADYTLDIHYSDRGEFSITIILPEKVPVGQESLYKSLIINNSYSGKTPFTIQGTALQMQPDQKIRVSFYRRLCSNGLMGWADDFTSLAEYDHWLRVGKPNKAIASTTVRDLSRYSGNKVDYEGAIHKKVSHKSIDLEWLAGYLKGIIERFLNQTTSVTALLYGRLSQHAPHGQVHELIGETGIPKQLAKQALERLRKEEKLLKVQPSLWLVYNAINYSLLNSRSSLTINDRYEWDERVLHHLASLTI